MNTPAQGENKTKIFFKKVLRQERYKTIFTDQMMVYAETKNPKEIHS